MNSLKATAQLGTARLAGQQHRLEALGNSQKGGPGQNEKLREACEEFEAIFTQQLLSAMREATVESGLMPKSSGEKAFQSMLDEQRSLQMAKSGSLGLGEMIYQQLQERLKS